MKRHFLPRLEDSIGEHVHYRLFLLAAMINLKWDHKFVITDTVFLGLE